MVSDKKIFLTPKKSILYLLKDEKICQQPKQSVLNFSMSIEDIRMNNTIKFVEEEGNKQHNYKSNTKVTKADLKKKKQKVLNKWLSQMKHNPHFLSVLNKKLAKQEKKQNQEIEFLKDMGCRANLSDCKYS